MASMIEYIGFFYGFFFLVHGPRAIINIDTKRLLFRYLYTHTSQYHDMSSIAGNYYVFFFVFLFFFYSSPDISHMPVDTPPRWTVFFYYFFLLLYILFPMPRTRTRIPYEVGVLD